MTDVTSVPSLPRTGGSDGDARSGETSVPLYLQVARKLQEQISAGVYAVGSLLPTELELAEMHGVSRQTIRQAVQRLRQQKLLVARKGVGTRVEARRPEEGYYYALHSLKEIFQFASETTLHVEHEKLVKVRGALAAQLASRSGRSWLHLVGVRKVAGHDLPICWAEVYVDGAHARLIQGMEIHQAAIFSAIERHSGEAVTEVKQNISATVLAPAMAARLGAPEQSPALVITRRYFGAGRRLFEMSVSIHPADRFSYAMTLKRDVSV